MTREREKERKRERERERELVLFEESDNWHFRYFDQIPRGQVGARLCWRLGVEDARFKTLPELI